MPPMPENSIRGNGQELRLMRWFEQHRMAWIAETLRIFGFINREHLIRKFDLSVPQASHDLCEFQRQYPEAMTYDKSAKRYVATKGA